MSTKKIEEKIINYDNLIYDGLEELKIPIKYTLPDITAPDFVSSFRSSEFRSVIIHSILIEIPSLSYKEDTNIFVRKPPLKDKNDNKAKKKKN